MFPSVYLLVLLVVWQVLDFVVHELNTVWHELLHLLKTFLFCWIWGGGGGSTVSDISSLMFGGGYSLWHL